MKMRVPIITFVCLVIVVIPCRGRIITVDDDGPADFDNIQAAINDANDGDTVEVQPGTYTGEGNRDIDFNGLAITLRSTNSNDTAVVGATVIDCQGSPGQFYRGFLFDSGEDSNTVLEGLTITGGFAVNFSGGIACFDSNPTIRNCIIQGNVGYPGGGVVCFGSSPMVTNCIIRDNNSLGDGGGLGCFDSSDPQITNCTFTGNSAFNSGDGIYCFDSSPTITNCILWRNTPEEVYVYSGTPAVSYCNVQGGWPVGTGNIDADPCFADPCNGDYHLKSKGWRCDADANEWAWDEVTSRCIDAGNPGCPTGSEPLPHSGNRINMGAYGGTAEASIAPHDWAILGDLNNDGTVNFEDYAFQAADWDKTEDCQGGDLNRDGSIDMNDIALLGEDWLELTSWHE